MVSHLNSFKYVERDGEFVKNPCQNFEVVSQITPIDKDTHVVPKMASLKDARVVVKEDGCTIWGQLPDIPYKYDKFGLGFTSQAQWVVRRARANYGRPPFCINHNGVHNNQVNTVEDADSDCDIDSWIFPTTCGGLNNWKTEDFIPISFSQD